MNALTYFQQHVLRLLPDEQVRAFFTAYPHISLTPENGLLTVAELPVLMLVALTGTGKSTTLKALDAQHTGQFRVDGLPTRRDIADFIIIPTAQQLLGHTVEPVSNRERRFFYTRTFAEHFTGGMAAVYASLYSRPTPQVIVSEGIRGADEIDYALTHCTGWQVLELSLDPVTRLQRLSSREDAFDQAAGTHDLAFLPVVYHERVRQFLASGDISAKAITIMRAEAQNYGLHPYATTRERYRCLSVDDLTPQEIAADMWTLITEMIPHAAY